MVLGERIFEIFQENGIKFQPFSISIGMSDDTLSRIVKGYKVRKTGQHEYRNPLPFELQQIADGLDITVDRLTGKDVVEKVKVLEELLETGRHPQKAYSLASELHPLALGATERMKFNLYLGKSLIAVNKVSESKNMFYDAYRYAKMTSNFDLAKQSAINICLYYYHSKDYDGMCQSTHEFQNYFKEDPDFKGKHNMLLGLCALFNSQLEEAREHFNQAIEQFVQIGDKIQHGRTLHNLAEIEFKEKDYSKTKQLLQSAIEMMEMDSEDEKLKVNKDMIRTLVKLGDYQEALELIELQLQKIDKFELHQPEIQAKILLMKSEITQTDEDAVSIFSIIGVSDDIKLSASNYLADFYFERGDYKKSASYAQKLKTYLSNGFKTGSDL